MNRSPSLGNRAVRIARNQVNARNNEGQGRFEEIQNAINSLRYKYGNQAANNAIKRARAILNKTEARRKQRVNSLVRTAAMSFITARERAARAMMAPVLRELNALRWVPVVGFKAPRGRSPSPIRSAKRARAARNYSPS